MKTTFTDKILIFFLCSYMAILPGCGGDSMTNSENKPPELPPQETMIVDISLFGFQGGNQVFKNSDLDGAANFARALVFATVVNLWVVAGLSVPVAATAAALSVEPTFDEADGKWHWNFSYPDANPTLTLELTGQINGNVINWEMFVTRQLPTPLTDFLWYTGETRIDGTSGHWQFYDESRPEENHENIKIDYVYNSETDRTLTFLNNNVGSDGFGDSLTYQVNGEIVTMLLDQVSENKSVEISWNTQTREGYIDENGVKGCWDSNLADTACPEN